jgi:hypothetical protein
VHRADASVQPMAMAVRQFVSQCIFGGCHDL